MNTPIIARDLTKQAPRSLLDPVAGIAIAIDGGGPSVLKNAGGICRQNLSRGNQPLRVARNPKMPTRICGARKP